MLLVVDVGNTNFTFGIFDGEELEVHISYDNKVAADIG